MSVVGWVVERDGIYYLDSLESTNHEKVFIRPNVNDGFRRPDFYLLGESFFPEEKKADALRAAKHNLQNRVSELRTFITNIDFSLRELHELL